MPFKRVMGQVVIDRPEVQSAEFPTEVIPIGGDQFVISANGTGTRTNSTPVGVFAKIYRSDISQCSGIPPGDATAGRLLGPNEWRFEEEVDGDCRIPGAVGATGEGTNDNILLVWIFYGGDSSDAANYDKNERPFRGLLVDPPPGGGSVGDT